MEKSALYLGLIIAALALSGCSSPSRSDYAAAEIPPLQSNITPAGPEVPPPPPPPVEPVKEKAETPPPPPPLPPEKPAVTVAPTTPETPVAIPAGMAEVPVFKDEKVNELIRAYNEYIQLAINAIKTKDAHKIREMEEKLLTLAQEGKGVTDKLDENERKIFNDYVTKLVSQVKTEAQKQP